MGESHLLQQWECQIVFTRDRYWLKSVHIPESLIINKQISEKTRDNLCLVDLEVSNGLINQIILPSADNFGIDCQKSILLPCFADVHTHLDKGHIWERSPNLDGTFASALRSVREDSKYWQESDLYLRMEFGLKCSYAHGTRAVRTHLDCFDRQASIVLPIWQDLQKKWQDKIALQGVSLVSLDYFQTPQGVVLADKIAQVGGILGGVAYHNPDLESQLDTVFRLATERGLNLDFHADENGDADSTCLEKIAETAIKYKFEGKVICGHCCSLAVQPPEVVQRTIELVRQANVAIVSLPLCNLYLQDRQPARTPFWRGITRVHELKRAGIAVAFASDNCRDPFFGFGDHDLLEVFEQSVRIAHLDTPYSNWIDSVTQIPADLMGLPAHGRIAVGLSADFILFKARYFSELLSRPQSDRLVFRRGKPIDTTLPDYAELDPTVADRHGESAC